MMRIFVSEFVCSGGWPGPLDTSLRTEGQAMLLAVLRDFLALPECVVTTTWDIRLGEFPLRAANLHCHRVSSPEEEVAQYLRLAGECDAALVIAPECDGILTRRRELLGDFRGQWLGCGLEEIRLFGSKRWTSQWLEARGIATVRTWLADEFLSLSDPIFPVVLKPDDGAGSQSTFLCHTPEELRRFLSEVSGLPIVQPFIPGEAWSTALLVRSGCFELFPPARQHLSDDGRFSYLGGEIDYPSELPSPVLTQLEQMARTLTATLPSLNGYLGIDWVLSEATGLPVILEVNPRLTTSYLGYRQLCRTNLAGAMLAEESPTLDWRRGRVRFTAAGEIW